MGTRLATDHSNDEANRNNPISELDDTMLLIEDLLTPAAFYRYATESENVTEDLDMWEEDTVPLDIASELRTFVGIDPKKTQCAFHEWIDSKCDTLIKNRSELT